MKVRTGGLLLSLTICISSYVNAKPTPNVERFGVKINISAGVVDYPCSVALTSRDQSIALPPVQLNELNIPGKRSNITWFSLQLNNCLAGKTLLTAPDTLTGYWSPSGPILGLIFSGAQDKHNTALYSVTGTAKGIGLRLFNVNHEYITPGKEDHKTLLRTGGNWLTFGVAVERSADRIQLGNFSGIINIQFKYY